MLKNLLWLGGLAGLAQVAYCQTTPAWWASRGLLSGSADDYAAVNVGQLKYTASLAALEMDLRLPSGAGTAVHLLVDPWVQPQVNGDDFAAINAGQLKAVAKLFYDRLGLPYPWTAATTDDDDYALINMGQLKYAFKFSIAAPGDTDADGLPDSWELSHFSTLAAQSGSGDSESPGPDGLSNRAEYLAGTNPSVAADSSPAAVAALALVVYSP